MEYRKKTTFANHKRVVLSNKKKFPTVTPIITEKRAITFVQGLMGSARPLICLFLMITPGLYYFTSYMYSAINSAIRPLAIISYFVYPVTAIFILDRCLQLLAIFIL